MSSTPTPSEGAQPPGPDKAQTEQELRERMHGLGESTEFDRAMQARLPENAAPEATAQCKEILDQHGIDPNHLDPAAAPDADKLKNLTQEDWAEIQSAPNPLLVSWSRANRRQVEKKEAELQELAKTDSSKELKARLGPQDPKEKIAEEALRRALPLTHGTTLEALMVATEEGTFSSNRAVHEKGVDVTAGAGNTTSRDREVGLDHYVFADYARPHSRRQKSQPEVVVVLEPEAMLQEGAFITDNDLLDMVGEEGDLQYRTYISRAYTGEDFAHVVLPKIHNMNSARRDVGGWDRPQTLQEFAGGADSNPDQTGQAHFSTFEVKLPNKTSTGYTRKLIFKNPDQAADFQKEYGDQVSWEITVEPELNKHPEALGTQERYQQEYQQVIQADHDERRAIIEATPKDQLTESYVILDKLGDLPPGVDAGLVRPEWFQIGLGFSSAEEALEKAKEGHMAIRRRQYGAGKLQIHSPQVEIARVVSNGNVSVITEHQPHDLTPQRRRAAA